VLKYERREINITYGIPVQVYDMSVFTLDKNAFPGCSDLSKVYEEPELRCPSSSSSDVSPSPAGSDVSPSPAGSDVSPSPAGSEIRSVSLSSASATGVAVAAVVLAVAIAVL